MPLYSAGMGLHKSQHWATSRSPLLPPSLHRGCSLENTCQRPESSELAVNNGRPSPPPSSSRLQLSGRGGSSDVSIFRMEGARTGRASECLCGSPCPLAGQERQLRWKKTAAPIISNIIKWQEESQGLAAVENCFPLLSQDTPVSSRRLLV